jgi:molybdenum cofactor cytidylyltransferase
MTSGVLIAILAAGRGRRFGADKLSADCAGQPLGSYALNAARATGLPIIWISASHPVPAHSIGWTPPDCEIIINDEAEHGMGSSVARAAQIAQQRAASALLILLADMPLVSTALITQLLRQDAPAAYRHTKGNPGPPALFHAAIFPKLAQLSGDKGASSLLLSLPELTLLNAAKGELADVDSPEDLAEVARRLSI